jgi:hypothetical protein
MSGEEGHFIFTKKQHIRDMGPINDGQYISFQNDVNYGINTLGHVNLNIFTDASGNNYAVDSNGKPIQNNLITRMVYTYPYIDNSGNFIDGYFEITFLDGGTWGNTDANDSAFWYSIEGIYPVVIYQFT